MTGNILLRNSCERPINVAALSVTLSFFEAYEAGGKKQQTKNIAYNQYAYPYARKEKKAKGPAPTQESH